MFKVKGNISLLVLGIAFLSFFSAISGTIGYAFDAAPSLILNNFFLSDSDSSVPSFHSIHSEVPAEILLIEAEEVEGKEDVHDQDEAGTDATNVLCLLITYNAHLAASFNVNHSFHAQKKYLLFHSLRLYC